ncbi:carbamoyltransferase HypF [Eggerthella sinensis]|uniref:carbamoyltransferase HypF n=1 Tax=Eggerthella sinensis TaxID=242230 RepID=UPI00248DC65A|nr:carbamoyltransferase HypF [Eggerthella sinensis]
MKEALDIQVKGIVQGVGFRPFVYRLAKKYLIDGWVLNATDGVFIHAEGETKLLDEFVIELSENPPAASRVEEVTLKEVPLEDFDSFEIRFSDAGTVEKTTLVSPDLATCDDCAHELFNPNDRRYRYPFVNCTNCGPRFTIIERLPYDRKSTSMKEFPMCERCAREYGDPLDRRFHAQPDACFECGPHLSWREHEGDDIDAPLGPISWGATREESDAILARAVELLRAGKILAVKGLGGFHLVCDAQNPEAVALLRARKRREGKAFAVMMQDAEAVRAFCGVGEAEGDILAATQRPIVLLRKREDAAFAPGLADRLPELGVMLPYTPIQHLLLHDFAEAGGAGMLVMTSGNIHDEPIVIDDEDAYEKLFGVADAFLGHNRAIRARYDDSVVRVIEAGSAGEAVQFIRRARGYAPLPLALPPIPCSPSGAPAPVSLFATGPEQKNTFALTRDSEAFVSQHIGDLENAETYDAWLQAKNRYETLFEIEPTHLVCDLHPEYLASKWAREQSEKRGLPLTEVQHHQAHIVSVMGEHGLTGPVCGIAFDGTGYGMDGAIWGGEVLLSNLSAFERFANFAYVPMPGGAAAVKHPLRMAYGVLWAFDLLEHPGAQQALAALGEQAAICEQMIDRGINTPMTSSVGRLFDAASALLGVCTEPTYEGEPAILLEAAIGEGAAPCAPSSCAPAPCAADGTCEPATPPRGAMGGDAVAPGESVPGESAPVEGAPGESAPEEGAPGESASEESTYPLAVVKNTATSTSTAQDTSIVLFDAAPTFAALLDDLAAQVPTAVIARRFHDAFVQAIVMAAELVRSVYDINTVALSGGVFMNRYLLEHSLAQLESAGFTVAVNRDLPPNDGCISFGQAVVAWASNNEEGEQPCA